MTPEEKKQFEELLAWKKQMESSALFPLYVDQAIAGRGFIKASINPLGVSGGGTGAGTLTGILKGNGTAAVTAIVPISGSGTFYVAASSGGAVTKKVDYNSGVITAIT